MNPKYADMLNLPHHVSSTRAPMSMTDRAAQFSPFAALVGHDAAIQETARLTQQPAELDESRKAALNDQLQQLLEHLPEQPEIAVTYFRPDEKKAGGSYVTAAGRLRKISPYFGTLELTDGTVIAVNRIYEIIWQVEKLF